MHVANKPFHFKWGVNQNRQLTEELTNCGFLERPIALEPILRPDLAGTAVHINFH